MTEGGKIDWRRLAEAHRARPVVLLAPDPQPRRAAQSSDPCPRCGVSGWKGCAHQLPYEAHAVERPRNGYPARVNFGGRTDSGKIPGAPRAAADQRAGSKHGRRS